MFLIEIFNDSSGNTVTAAYGYAGRGTFAAAIYFKDVFLPSLGCKLTPGYIIVECRDLSDNALPEIPYDSFGIITKQP